MEITSTYGIYEIRIGEDMLLNHRVEFDETSLPTHHSSIFITMKKINLWKHIANVCSFDWFLIQTSVDDSTEMKGKKKNSDGMSKQKRKFLPSLLSRTQEHVLSFPSTLIFLVLWSSLFFVHNFAIMVDFRYSASLFSFVFSLILNRRSPRCRFLSIFHHLLSIATIFDALIRDKCTENIKILHFFENQYR